MNQPITGAKRQAALGNWLYGFFVLPESLPPERRQPRFDWTKANPVGSLQLVNRHPGLPVLIAAALMLASTVLAYAKARPLPAPEPRAA